MEHIDKQKIIRYLGGLYVSSDKIKGIAHEEYSGFTDNELSDTCAYAAIFLIGALIENDEEVQKKEIQDELGFQIRFSEEVENYGQPTAKTLRNAIFHQNIWRCGNKIVFKDRRPKEKEFHTTLTHENYHILLPKLINFIVT